MTPLDIESLREHHLTPLERELLDHVVELTRQLEDARNIAVRCGAFETWTGTDVETYVSGARADEL